MHLCSSALLPSKRSLFRSAAAICLWVGAALAFSGPVQAADHGFSGMEIQGADQSLRLALGATEGRGGLFVRDVMPGGPAEQAGFLRGDLLTDFEGVSITSLNQVVAYMQSTKPGQAITFIRWRHGQTAPQTITLSSWPAGWDVRTNAVAVVPQLGATLVALTPEVRDANGLRWGRTGVLVRSLEPSSQAQAWGIEAGDLLVSVGRTVITDPADVDGLLSAMGKGWFVLLERDNQVSLVGPGVGKPLVVATPSLLVAKLSDGPFVMDTASSAYPGAQALGTVPLRGAILPGMPTASPSPSSQEQKIPELGLTVASLSDERRKAMRLHWSSQGVVVTEIVAGGRAQRAGLAPGHVIWSINQGPPPTVADMAAVLQSRADGKGSLTPKSGSGATKDPHAAVLLVEARNGFFFVSLPLTEGMPIDSSASNPLSRFMDDAGPGKESKTDIR